MSLFEKPNAEEQKIDGLRDEVRKLTTAISELRGEREALRDATKLQDQIDRLKKEKTEKEIELDRANEKHARTEREIDHKLGLHRQKVTQETELAEQKARLAVQQENLEADRERFKAQIEDARESMKSEMEATRDLMKQVMDRIPKFETIRRESLTLGAGASNGHGADDDVS